MSTTASNGRLGARLVFKTTLLEDFGMVIHEFDPWFNYRATEYLAENGPTLAITCRSFVPGAALSTLMIVSLEAHLQGSPKRIFGVDGILKGRHAAHCRLPYELDCVLGRCLLHPPASVRGALSHPLSTSHAGGFVRAHHSRRISDLACRHSGVLPRNKGAPSVGFWNAFRAGGAGDRPARPPPQLDASVVRISSWLWDRIAHALRLAAKVGWWRRVL